MVLEQQVAQSGRDFGLMVAVRARKDGEAVASAFPQWDFVGDGR